LCFFLKWNAASAAVGIEYLLDISFIEGFELRTVDVSTGVYVLWSGWEKGFFELQPYE